jgi:rhodanese-related sulfurtransferase
VAGSRVAASVVAVSVVAVSVVAVSVVSMAVVSMAVVSMAVVAVSVVAVSVVSAAIVAVSVVSMAVVAVSVVAVPVVSAAIVAVSVVSMAVVSMAVVAVPVEAVSVAAVSVVAVPVVSAAIVVMPAVSAPVAPAPVRAVSVLSRRTGLPVAAIAVAWAAAARPVVTVVPIVVHVSSRSRKYTHERRGVVGRGTDQDDRRGGGGMTGGSGWRAWVRDALVVVRDALADPAADVERRAADPASSAKAEPAVAGPGGAVAATELTPSDVLVEAERICHLLSIGEELLIIDLRDRATIDAQGTVDGAVSLTVDDVLPGALPPDQDVFFVCADGRISAALALRMRAEGAGLAWAVDGGAPGWLRAAPAAATWGSA